jgi:AcrR family transcriptional regulator
MARKPQRPRSAPKRAPALTPPTGTDRDKIVVAFMALLADKRFEEIGFGEIATRSGLTLANCRAEFGSTIAIYAAHMKELDRKVLAGVSADMAEEPPRERLFDVLMRRIEVMAPYREATRSMLKSLSCNPGLALALNGFAVRSQHWMLTAADIDAAGPRGAIRAQGLAALFARVLRTWVDDEDDNARTMAALDRALARGQRWSGMLDDLCRFRPLGFLCRRRRRSRDEEEQAEAA